MAIHWEEKREKLIDTVPKEAQTLDLLDKDFQSTILNILKEIKDIMDKELIKGNLEKNVSQNWCTVSMQSLSKSQQHFLQTWKSWP